MAEEKKPLWIPSEEKIKNSNLNSYTKYLKEKHNLSFLTYDELYSWSVTEIESFWETIWEYSDIIHSKKYSKVLDERKMPGAKWFSGSEINFAQNLLRFKDERTAIISIREGDPTIIISYQHLFRLVAACAEGLKRLGVKKNDCVAGFVSNFPEAVIAMLAATSLGAIWTSCSPDFGIQGVYDRFGQVKPKVLFATESYNYNGKKIDCTEKIKKIVNKIKEIEKVVLIPAFSNLNSVSFSGKSDDEIRTSNFIYFNQLIDNTSKKIEFIQTPFDHPVYIMYSSGTTGLPKCMVHGAGGTLLQHYKEHVLHTNLTRDSVIIYFTTCGWMMWNWLVGALQTGAAIVLYDGSAVYPNTEFLWKTIDDIGITAFGTSPKYLSICQKSELIPKDKFSLSSLRCILSTGSPLTKDNYEWVYQNVNSDLQLSSISGGTDIVSCFMLGNPVMPVYSEEIQCRGLGMNVKAFNDKGESVIGEKGELVCTQPFPSMPVYFWDDKDGEKYHNAYFNKFPGVWTHGDYIKITENGGIVVFGRSDATLNPGGVRIGTAEIYRIVESMDEVADSIVVGKRWNGDIKVVLFVVLKNQLKLNKEMIDMIKLKIRQEATPRHVPAQVHQVNEIPHTINGKKVELAVTKILNGEEIENKDVLANPISLDQFRKFIKE